MRPEVLVYNGMYNLCVTAGLWKHTCFYTSELNLLVQNTCLHDFTLGLKWIHFLFANNPAGFFSVLPVSNDDEEHVLGTPLPPPPLQQQRARGCICGGEGLRARP